jgi:hypothetical protein
LEAVAAVLVVVEAGGLLAEVAGRVGVGLVAADFGKWPSSTWTSRPQFSLHRMQAVLSQSLVVVDAVADAVAMRGSLQFGSGLRAGEEN